MPRLVRTPYERLMQRVQRVGDCLIYTGSKDRKGYGTVSVGHNGCLPVHRVVYEHHNGPIPEALQVRHTCDTPACCEPSHLILGTVRDNAQDCKDRGRHNPWNRGVTHCKNHHEFTPENTYIHPTRGTRGCRKCRQAASDRYSARKKEKVL